MLSRCRNMHAHSSQTCLLKEVRSPDNSSIVAHAAKSGTRRLTTFSELVTRHEWDLDWLKLIEHQLLKQTFTTVRNHTSSKSHWQNQLWARAICKDVQSLRDMSRRDTTDMQRIKTALIIRRRKHISRTHLTQTCNLSCYRRELPLSHPFPHAHENDDASQENKKKY